MFQHDSAQEVVLYVEPRWDCENPLSAVIIHLGMSPFVLHCSNAESSELVTMYEKQLPGEVTWLVRLIIPFESQLIQKKILSWT